VSAASFGDTHQNRGTTPQTIFPSILNSYNTKQKHLYEYFQSIIHFDAGRKTLHPICLKIWTDIPPDYRHCSFSKFKKYFKTNRLNKYYDP